MTPKLTHIRRPEEGFERRVVFVLCGRHVGFMGTCREIENATCTRCIAEALSRATRVGAK